MARGIDPRERQPCSLVVAAHPDDEVIGAGIWICRHATEVVNVLHITDGSPRDMADAKALGFNSPSAYAAARRRELAEAMVLAQVPMERCYEMGFPDKEAFLHMTEIIRRLQQMICRLRPAVVLSPAYEGGHPDHDAAAFAVAIARRLGVSFHHLEYPLYHSGPDGHMVTGTFLDDKAGNVETLELSSVERQLKSQLLQTFYTQREMLRNFPVQDERFRDAPEYDFTRAPHVGTLLYERWGWPMSGRDWRRQASLALSSVGERV